MDVELNGHLFQLYRVTPGSTETHFRCVICDESAPPDETALRSLQVPPCPGFLPSEDGSKIKVETIANIICIYRILWADPTPMQSRYQMDLGWTMTAREAITGLNVILPRGQKIMPAEVRRACQAEVLKAARWLLGKAPN